MDSSQQKTLRGHDAPVLSVTFDPTDEYIVRKKDVFTAHYFYLFVYFLNAGFSSIVLFTVTLSHFAEAFIQNEIQQR